MTIDEMVNLASMVQREGLMKDDLPKISAVFHNRLLNSAVYPLLESDATILYSYGRIVYCDTKQWHFDGRTIDCADCLSNKPKLDSDGKIVYGEDGSPVIEGCGARDMYSYRYIRPDLTVLDTKAPSLTQDELRGTDLPYNSYIRGGLLPGPICNPGLESLWAAFLPEEDFPNYFFVTDMAGRAHFARTLAEHNGNVERIRNERAAAAQANP
jgi:cell division protein YceG involved in septum cleavage